MADIQHLFPSQDQLGEGPLWDYRQQQLFWVDIDGKRIHQLDLVTCIYTVFHIPVKVGVLGLRRSGGFVMATQNGFAFWQPETNEISYITDPEADKPLSRFNDGAVDRVGRFWAGSYGAKNNHLYRLDADLSVQRLASGLKIPNGIGWSPDNRYLYFTDSMKHKIYRYEFELETGQIRKRITWVDSEKQPGVPDGLTVDQEGNVWSARWDGWCIDVYNPAGRQIDKISVPVPRPTSICFGGPDLRTLYITSARGDLDDQVLNQAPLSGDLFRLEVEVQGLPEPLFVG